MPRHIVLIKLGVRLRFHFSADKMNTILAKIP